MYKDLKTAKDRLGKVKPAMHKALEIKKRDVGREVLHSFRKDNRKLDRSIKSFMKNEQ